MTLDKHLEKFYKENNIPIDGGINDTSFNFKVFGINLKLPNPKFRRDAIHIHDLQHVLNNCDTSWKGESFISGWEISTGMWKYFPLGLLSLWAMGYGIWLYPKDIYLGYKKEGYIIMLTPFLCLLVAFQGYAGFIAEEFYLVLFIPLLIYVIVLIEFFIYLFKSDEDFEKTYIQNKKGWL